MAMAAVANEGLMRPPRIVEALERDGGVILRPEAPVARRVLSAGLARKLGAVLREVVAKGTGRNAEVPGYGAAGKTGTAQKAEPGVRGYSKEKFVSSFVGFIPYKNPRIALLVVFDEGKLGGVAWGGTIAAPVWRRIAWQTMRYLRVPPEGAKVVRLGDEVFPPGRRTRAEKASLGETFFELVERVRGTLHPRPAPRRPLEPAR